MNQQIGEYYRYYILDSDKNIQDTLEPRQTTSRDETLGIDFYINLVESQSVNLVSYDDIEIIDFSYSPGHDQVNTNDTYQFRLEATLNDNINKLCMIMKDNYGNELQESCLSGSTTTTYLNNITFEDNKAYYVRLVSYSDGVPTLLNPYFYFDLRNIKDLFSKEGVFYTLLLILLGALFGLINGSPSNTLIGAIAGLILSNIIGFMPYPKGVNIVLVIIMIAIVGKERAGGK